MPKTDKEMTATRARLAQFAEWTRTAPPEKLLDKEGAPTGKLLAYCRETGLSLDWLFLGDAKGLVMAEHRRAAEPREDMDAVEEIMVALGKARHRWAALDIITAGVVKISPVDQVSDARALLGVVSDLEDAIHDASRLFDTFCDRKGIQP